MNHLISCTCGEVIVKSLDADTKVRAKIIVFKEENAFAVCKACSAEIKIPLRLDSDMLKSMTSTVNEVPRSVRLFIRDVKSS